MRLRCVVAYDGTDFAGWQRQRSGRSVQAALESAIEHVTGSAVQVTGSGRTDAGVHAVGQVAHFEVEWARPVDALARALNAVLPSDVAVAALARAPGSFHARHSAISRNYRYVVLRQALLAPLMARMSLVWPGALDLGAMAEGAGRLIGTHDFGGFGRPMSAGGSTVRHLERAAVCCVGPAVVLEFEADGFLRHQVRRMTGLLLDIGKGRYPEEAVDQVLARAPEAPVARSALARGLILWAVRYPPDEEPWGDSRLEGACGEDLYA
jgi:tRNA pseudouridine38-40 synthase